MPGLVVQDGASKKRKRVENSTEGRTKVKSKKAPKTEESEQTQILLLEEEVLQSRKNYGNVRSLVELSKRSEKEDGTGTAAAVALCRIFCRLVAGEKMIKVKGMKEVELLDLELLKTGWKDYVVVLCDQLSGSDVTGQSTALTLLMRLAKEEVSQDGRRSDSAWRNGVFSSVIRSLVLSSSPNADVMREEFAEKYLEEHDDVRFFTFYAVAHILSDLKEDDYTKERAVAGCLSLLLFVEGVPDSEEQLEDWYGQIPEQPKHQLLSITAHKKQAQEAWLAIFRSSLSKDQRKSILGSLSHRITPWFTKVELLMDFLTDSYDAGGATSLLALSGLFYLMQEKNLDYPQFFPKLYSLLDENILHSKHRSRFFRLLNTFMSSTHLPAALVASFIKRLSRLALHAPPGGIVVIVPWVYNILKKHPSCTFMIHREIRTSKARSKLEEEGMSDVFDMDQPDPMETNAIDSSLWEIETLQSHYHPNVATLAKIISEQFTKRDYNLEDFLDHSYKGIIDAELGKELKKAPVVEFEIPKRIFTTDEGDLDRLGGLLQNAIEAM